MISLGNVVTLRKARCEVVKDDTSISIEDGTADFYSAFNYTEFLIKHIYIYVYFIYVINSGILILDSSGEEMKLSL